MRKNRMKWLAGALSAVLMITVLAGCGAAAALSRPTPSAEGVTLVTINGSCAISKNGDVITVSGTIDAMNGARIDVSIVAQNGMVIANDTFLKTQDEISKQFTLTEEQLEGVVDMKGYITFAPSYNGNQPKEVFGVYGNKFENINNTENVLWKNEGVIVLFKSDWLYGMIPEVTPAPTLEATPAPATEATATPSA